MTDPIATMLFLARQNAKKLENVAKEGGSLNVYGQSICEPILGHYTELPPRETNKINPTLNTSLPYVCKKKKKKLCG